MVMAKKRIGVLTGGGDVPGLNSVIKTVTYRSSENDIAVVGLRRGWEALTHLNFDDPDSRRRYAMTLDRENTRTIPTRWHRAALEPHQPGQNAKVTRSPRRQGVSALAK
jgi:6-phosphofructokinase